MKQLLMLLAAAGVAVGLTAGQARAEKVKQPGALYVFDDAKLFSAEGIEAAKSAFRNVQFDHALKVTVDTYAEVPAEKRAAAEAAAEASRKGDRAKWRAFMENWAKEAARNDKAEGPYILIVRKPTGGVAVLADRQTRERGFTDADEQKVWDILVAALRDGGAKAADATAAHDRGLKAAVEYIASDLKDTTVRDAGGHKAASNRGGGGMGIGGWVCLGLCVALGAWLVIGLIRALTGGGGGPGGYGGGGGGFMSSLFGGLFGAMAGMWMYNNFFGGGGMFGGGSDAYAGDNYSGGGDTGAGDYGGETGAAGGYDDGGAGGGDWGGGGDFGGGGGDFGGGGGDF